MRILYVSLDPRQPYNSRTGGATHMREMVSALREEDAEVLVFAPGADSTETQNPKPRLKPGALQNTARFLMPNRLWMLARDLNDIRSDRKMEAALERAVGNFAPEVIYERNSYLFASCARVAAAAGIPYFLEINAPTAEERIANFGAPLASWHRRIEAIQRRTAAGIIVVSDPLKRYLVDAGVDRKKIKVIPNGVSPARFKGSTEKGAEIRSKLGLTGPVIGFVGALASYHGIDSLMEAMPQVRDKFPDVVALIVGGGPLLEGTQNRARHLGLAGMVKFTGEVDPDEVPGYIGVFDVAVLPKTAEYCSPIKLFEYGAAGVPIIAPNTQPVSSIMGSERNGMLLNAENTLASAIIKLLSDSKLSRAMGLNFRKRVMEHFTWRHTARSVLKFISERTR